MSEEECTFREDLTHIATITHSEIPQLTCRLDYSALVRNDAEVGSGRPSGVKATILLDGADRPLSERWWEFAEGPSEISQDLRTTLNGLGFPVRCESK